VFRHVGKSNVKYLAKLLPKRSIASIRSRIYGLKSSNVNYVSAETIRRYKVFLANRSTSIPVQVNVDPSDHKVGAAIAAQATTYRGTSLS
jgi:hypothetical protein